MFFDLNNPDYKLGIETKEIKDAARRWESAKNLKQLDARAAVRSHNALMYRFQLEKDEETRMLKQRELDERNRRQIMQEDKLAQELGKLKDEEMRQLKMRHLLRQNSKELRDLEAQLRQAYYTKELAAQVAEKECEKTKEKMAKLEIDEAHKQALVQDMEAEKIEMQDEINRKYAYKRDLQDQIMYKYKKKVTAYEEFLKEKKLIDDIIEEMHLENEKEMEEKMCIRKRTNEEIRLFKEAQELWRLKERKALEEENKRLEEFLLERESAVNTREIEAKKKKEMKAKLTEDLSKKLYLNQERMRERNTLVQDLLEEEYREMGEQKAKAKLKREIEMQIETTKVLEKQKEYVAEQRRQEKLENARYREQMIAKVAENQRLDQLTAEKRRIKMMELRRNFDDNLKENRLKKAVEMKKALQMEEEAKIEHEKQRKLIEAERIRILKEHVSNLVGYLPLGILKPDDLPHLGTEITNRIMNNLG